MVQKSIKKNTVLNSIKTAASIVFPLITFPYISRVLLPENIGKINFGLSIVSYFSLIASLGINTYAIRECSGVRNEKEKLSNTASQIFSINVITTIIAYLALTITLIFYGKLENYRMLIVIQSLTIIATTLGADWLNSAMEDFKYIAVRTITFQLVSLILMFIFVHHPEDYMKYAVISLVSSAGASISNIWYRRKYCIVSFTMKINWKKHMIPIIYMFVMILAQTIFNSVDSTMLGLMHGDREVGIYSAAHKIMRIVNEIVGSVLWVIMPRMSYYFKEGNYEQINRLLRKVLGFNFILGLPCAVGCIILSKEIILIVAGEQFIDAAPVLQILMVGFMFSLIGGNFLGNAILLPSKNEKYYMIVCCVTAVVNVIGNYIFIPQYGVIAAAITTSFCGLTILILLLFKVNKNITIENYLRLIISPILGCLMIIIVCILFRKINNLWIRTIVSVGCSIISYSFIECLLKNEIAISVLFVLKNKIVRK